MLIRSSFLLLFEDEDGERICDGVVMCGVVIYCYVDGIIIVDFFNFKRRNFLYRIIYY